MLVDLGLLVGVTLGLRAPDPRQGLRPWTRISRSYMQGRCLLVPAAAWRKRNIVGFWPYEKRGHPWVNASIPLGMIPAFRRMLTHPVAARRQARSGAVLRQ